MTYGVVTEVAAPIEVYDAVHAALLARADLSDIGLLVHVGQPTATGFRVIEVWESRERFDRFSTEVLPAVLAEVSATLEPGQPGAMPTPHVEEFEVRGLVLLAAGTPGSTRPGRQRVLVQPGSSHVGRSVTPKR